jgi:hypothetical protein
MITIDENGRPRVKGAAKRPDPPPYVPPVQDRAQVLHRLYGEGNAIQRRLQRLEFSSHHHLPRGWRPAAVSTCLLAFDEFGSSMDEIVNMQRRRVHDDHQHRHCLQAVCARLHHELHLSYRTIARIVQLSASAVVKLTRKGERFLRQPLLECKGSSNVCTLPSRHQLVPAAAGLSAELLHRQGIADPEGARRHG